MAIVTSKVFVFGVAALSAGGVTAGIAWLPNIVKGKREVSITKDTVIPKKVRKCNIYVTDEATTPETAPKITKILSKNTDISQFLSDKRSESNSEFAAKVEKACSGESEEKFVDEGDSVGVYVYEKNASKQWVYSGLMQKDWMKEDDINKDALNKPAVATSVQKIS